MRLTMQALAGLVLATPVAMSWRTPSAFGQEAVTLPTQIITATRVPTLAEQVPAGVTVIDRATMRRRGDTTLVDALEEVPGLRVVQSGGPGGNASVFIRGTNSNHVLVLRDGVPINDPSDPGGLYNFGTELVGDLDRIEVVRGPMSSLYGSGAIGGVINLISRRGEGPLHGTVSVAAGAPLQTRDLASLQGSSGRFDYNLGSELYADTGFDTTPRRESVYTGARNAYNAELATVELGYTPVDGTRVSAMLRGRQARFNLDELGFPAYDARDYNGHDNNVFGRLGGTTTLLQGVLESSLYVSRNQTNRKYVEPLEAADPNQASGTSKYQGISTDVQWNNTVHLPDASWSRDAALTFGYEYTQNESRSTVDTVSSGFGFTSTLDASAVNNAGHVGLQSTVLRRLTLTADAREQAEQYGGDAFTWRLGGVVAVPEAWSRGKLAYGTAFRGPSLYDLFGVDGTGYRGNPDLKPERSEGWEAGWAVDVPGFGRADAATLDVTYFNNRITDLIQFTYAPDFSSSTEANVAAARTQGVESSLTLRPATWLRSAVVWTYTETRDLTSGSALLRRPKNQVSLDATISPVAGLRITPQLIYTGPFMDYLVDNDGFTGPVGSRQGGFILNLTAQYDITPHLQVFGEGRNITGSRFEPASGYQSPGASVLAGLRSTF